MHICRSPLLQQLEQTSLQARMSSLRCNAAQLRCLTTFVSHCVPQVPRSFPLLSHIGIINAAGAAAGAAAASQALEQQLPGLLQQVRKGQSSWCHQTARLV